MISCRRVEVEFGVPTCIRKKIEVFSRYACKTGANVIEYKFNNKLVYVFSQGNCVEKMNAEVMDSNCNSLGFVENSSSNIIENKQFDTEAIFNRIVWKDKK
jgi:hypothetical protein